MDDFFPKSETIENSRDKKIWWWGEAIDDARKSGLKLATTEFWVYYKIRVYEIHGKYDACIAGSQRLADDIGVTKKQVEIALKSLRANGNICHIVCDTKIYRNKTKIDVTDAWCKEKGIDPKPFMIGDRGKFNDVLEYDINNKNGSYSTNSGSSNSRISENSGSSNSSFDDDLVAETPESPLYNKYKYNNIYNNLTNKENIVSLEEVDKPRKSNGSSVIDEHSDTACAKCTTPFDQPADFNGESDKRSTRAKYAQANELVGQLLPRFPQYKKAPKTIQTQAKHALEIYAPEAILSSLDAFFDAEWITNKSLSNFLSEGVLTRLVSATPDKQDTKPRYEPGHVQTSEEWIENFRRLNGLDK